MKKLTLLISIVLVLCLADSVWAIALGHWKLDEGSGTTVRDSSGKNNNGRFVGAPKWVTGKLGKALEFDGVDDYVEVPHSASLIPTTGKDTVAVWINARRHTGPNGGQWQGILAKGGSPRLYNLYTEASQTIHFSTGPSGAYIGPLSTGTVPLNEWVHIAVVCDGRDYFYINGEPAGVAGEGATVPTGGTAVLTIGQTGESNFFQGMIDDVWIFDDALTAPQVKELFNGNPPRWPKAVNPSPANGATGVTLGLFQWGAGDSGRFHNVYLGTTPELTEANLVGSRLPNTMYFQMVPPLVPGTTYYWRVDEVEADMTTIWTGDVWSFSVAPLTAYLPAPADGALYQDPNVDLSWAPGQNAFTHEVFFSTNKDDVAGGAAAASKGSMAVNNLELPAMPLETTYYWRVDETDAMGNKQVGPVWSFTTTIPGLGAAKRELWMNAGAGTSVNDLLADSRYPGAPTDVNEIPDFESPSIGDNYGGKLSAWLHVPVAGEYTFWVAGDDNTRLFLGADPDSAVMIAEVTSWSDAQAWDSSSAQKSKAIALEAGRYYLMALWKEGGGGDHCAAAWQGPGIPTRELIHGSYLMPFEALWAYGPRPRHGAVDATQTPELKWTAGIKAASHVIYFSDDANAVADGTVSAREQALEDTSFDPGTLEFGKTYYWRVDEVNPAEAGSPWKGSVWRFTTANFIVVDDFEDYVDDIEGRIFQTWIDGWGYTEPAPGNPGNGTSSTVGYTGAPFAETTIIHGGRQSMPFDYNNIIQPYYSETDRTWARGQNWTLNSMDTLSLWFQRYAAKYLDDGKTVTISAAGDDIWNAADAFRFVYKRLNGDGSITTKVDSIVQTDVWAKAGVMIRESLTPGSANAANIVSAASGVSFQWRPFADDVSANVGQSGLKAPYWVRLTRTGNTFKAEASADGKTWSSIGTDPTASSRDVVMGGSIYIGRCLTSHNTNAKIATTGVFSDVKTTGGVSGQWQVADIGMVHPGNDPAQLYVALQDSAGKVAVVNHPDLNAVLTTAWTEWQIPLSEFTGVNTKSIKKMYIGVGDRKAPQAGGHGKLFIDDIRVIKP